ncbi:hypothetical protein GCM10010123_44730 [Pilimelia anulata]|uniref:Uncharacterized protein n=1 Tax=Pilimelia anulata TaxID=53371 RepID=A0A8J3BHZ5_9ACTN|nr:hypothetical protein [Pilimelia anulata]GGK09863.1 hypothetical protein GCM10010123_44730 [Pilimelia anulata]
MKLEFIGKDPDSNGGDSPTVYRCPDRDSYVIQGWKIDAGTLASLNMPAHEDAIEIPSRMLRYLQIEK